MFDLGNRKNLTEIIAPENGFVLEKGMASTYSLDVEKLLVALIAMQGFKEVDKPYEDPPALLRAVTALLRKENFLMFCDSGGIKQIKNAGIVKQVDSIMSDVFIEGGKFHPKLWVLKYVPQEGETGEPYYRLICSSKNISGSELLEVSFTADGRQKKKINDGNRELRNFLKRLVSCAKIGAVGKKGFNSFVDELQSVEFEGGFDFLYQFGSGRQGKRSLKSRFKLDDVEKAVIISPFLNSSFIEGLCTNRLKELVLISSRSALMSLRKEKLPGAKVKAYYMSTDIEIEEEDSDLREMMKGGLHAKVYILEKKNCCEIWIGSANATFNGWEDKNTEVMIKVKANYGVGMFKKEFMYEKEEKLMYYLKLFNLLESTGEKPGHKLTEAVLSKIVQHEFTMEYSKSKKSAGLSVSNVADLRKDMKDVMEKVSVTFCIPGHNDTVNIKDLLKKGKVLIENVDITEVTDLVEITIKDLSGKRTLIRLIKAKSNLYKFKDARVDALANSIIKSKESLKSYIRYILMDARAGSKYRRGGGGSNGGSLGKNGQKREDFDLTMEDILLNYNPEKIKEIGTLMNRFGKTKVDAGLRRFWMNFKKIYDEVGR